MGEYAKKSASQRNNISKQSTQHKPSNNSQNLEADYIQQTIGQPSGQSLTPDNALYLQRTLGNKFVNKLVNKSDNKSVNRKSLPKFGQPTQKNGYIQRLAFDDPPPWGTVTVTRSGEGAAGVFFVKQGNDKVVLKPLNDVGNVEFANDFMEQGMGFEAPQVKSYKKSSTQGKALKRLLMANQDKGRDQDEVKNQVKTANYFMVMSLVEGKSIQTLDDNEATAFITDANALKDVGRMMAADSWLGNNDRLVGGRVNLGNFFYAAAGTINARVTTIDNDSKFGKAAFNSRGNLTGDLDTKYRYMDILLHPTNRVHMIMPFIAKFKQAHQNNANALAAVDDDFIKTNVGDGIDAGFEQMANVFKTNMDLVRTLGKYSKHDNRDYNAAKAMGEYVQERQTDTTPEDAVDKLKSYVTYRAKQDKTWKGFKWVSNLVNSRGFSKK